jgi:hypothetical protein
VWVRRENIKYLIMGYAIDEERTFVVNIMNNGNDERINHCGQHNE